jgi:hypothetical protein
MTTKQLGLTLLVCLIVSEIQFLHAESPPTEFSAINDQGAAQRYQVAKVNYPRVAAAFEIALWIYLGILTKIGTNFQLAKISFS